MPEEVTQLGTAGTTFLNPLGMLFVALLGVLILVLPRKHAVLPVLMLICYMTFGQRIMVGPFNFTMLRVLLFLGWVRIFTRGEFRHLKFNSIDKTLIWMSISAVITYTMLWQSVDALKNRMGFVYDILGYYFLFRMLIHDLDEAIHVVKMAAVTVVPLAAMMLLERSRGNNAFALFGGVPEITVARGGRLRCQGPFAHPILAGTFAGTIMPLFMGLWWTKGRGKLLSAVATISSMSIVFCASSSGPALAAMAGMFGMFAWNFKQHLRLLRWSVVAFIGALAIVMKAPVWFVIAKFDVFSGSTGWHRAYIIDRAYYNFGDWWLFGTKSTMKWGDYEFLWDITNQYIAHGVNGGLLTMSLFIAMIAFCFQRVGREAKKPIKSALPKRMFIWSMGASLFAHAVNYMSVPYFDQNGTNWYMLVAMVAGAAVIPTTKPTKVAENVPLAADSDISLAPARQY